MKAAIVCTFTSGLSDMTRKQQRDHVAVLRALKSLGRFSVFDASANTVIATTITRLMTKGLTIRKADGTETVYGQLLESTGGEYPWTTVKLTPAGEQLLKDSEAA